MRHARRACSVRRRLSPSGPVTAASIPFRCTTPMACPHGVSNSTTSPRWAILTGISAKSCAPQMCTTASSSVSPLPVSFRIAAAAVSGELYVPQIPRPTSIPVMALMCFDTAVAQSCTPHANGSSFHCMVERCSRSTQSCARMGVAIFQSTSLRRSLINAAARSPQRSTVSISASSKSSAILIWSSEMVALNSTVPSSESFASISGFRADAPGAGPVHELANPGEASVSRPVHPLILVGEAPYEAPLQVGQTILYRDADGRGLAAFVNGGLVHAAGKTENRIRHDGPGSIEERDPQPGGESLLNLAQRFG